MGFVLMVINKIAGFVLPYSSKFLIDNVVSKGQTELLRPLVLSVLIATLIQGVTSFSLTQLLSKAARAPDCRFSPAGAAAHLPAAVAFYDANRTGALVSRIMTDVEGVRNLLGTGLVDFVGGLRHCCAGLRVAAYAISGSILTLIVFGSPGCFVIRILQPGFHDHSPYFPRAREDQRGCHRPIERVAGRSSSHQGLSRGRS